MRAKYRLNPYEPKKPVQPALTPVAPEAQMSATQKPLTAPMGPVSPVEGVVNASMPQKGGTVGKALRQIRK